MNRSYRPKRSAAHWLDSAPRDVIACYDSGPNKGADRYTVLFGGAQWSPELGQKVLALGMDERPYHPQGIGMTFEHPACDRACLGRKIRWVDLPAECQRAARAFCGDTAVISAAAAGWRREA